MKKFVFTLAALYNYKKIQERQKQIECAEAREILKNLISREEELNAELECAAEKYRKNIREKTTVHSLMTYSRYQKELIDDLGKIAEEIVKAQKVLEAKQEELVAILREIKTLENLKQEQYREYIKELEKEEDRVIGDIVSFNTGVVQEEE